MAGIRSAGIRSAGIRSADIGGADIARRAGDEVAYRTGGEEPTGTIVDAFSVGGGGGDRANITGTSGDDYLYGTDGDDLIEARAGNDNVYGGSGNDTLRGEDGDDSLGGGAGDDVLEGGAGKDYLSDNEGSDRLFGGDGDDWLEAGYGGSDELWGEGGDDKLFVRSYYGSAGISTVASGGAGNDEISISVGSTGQAGTIAIDGGDGADLVTLGMLTGVAATIKLGAGSDTLRFESYYDVIAAQAPVVSDFQAGDAGDRIDWIGFLGNNLSGWDRNANPFAQGYLRLVQSGADVLLQLDRDAGGTYYAFRTVLVLGNVSATSLTAYNLGGYPSDGSAAPGFTFTGTAGNDTIVGGVGADVIDGLGGNDTLSGDAGDDTINGGDGNDRIGGGTGGDTLYGGAGDDSLSGDEGDDRLFGGDGSDYLYTSIGSDELNGEGGDDRLSISYYGSGPAVRVAANGGDGNDSIVVNGYVSGSVFTISGGAGEDLVSIQGLSNSTARVSLDAGADVLKLDYNFSYEGSSIVVEDFATGAAGDRVDMAQFLNSALYGWDRNLNPFGTGHLRLVQSGADALLQVDRDGRGTSHAFITTITFRNVDAASFVARNLGGYPADGGVPPGETFRGTSGNDRIDGSVGGDLIEGLDGDDQLYGLQGDDTIRGGNGADRLFGGLGNDRLEGGAGNDQLYADQGDDRLFGGDGDDYLNAQEVGNKEMYGEAGNDSIYVTYIYSGYAILASGGAGDDNITVNFYSSGASATVDGGEGADKINLSGLYGSTVTVTLGAGQDELRIGNLYGGGVVNVVDFETGNSGDRIDWKDYFTYGFTGYAYGSNPFPTVHARLTRSGADTLLQVDRDGTGTANGFETVVTFRNVGPESFTAYNLGGWAQFTQAATAGADTITGTAGIDIVDGGAGDDLFLFGQGGNDTAYGGAGDDGFYFGAALTAADRVDGGEGSDQLGLQGRYALTLGSESLVGVETLVLLPGSDTRFGDTSGAFYSYNLTTVDANVAAGQLLTVNMNTLRVGENVVFDGRAETDGSFFFYGGSGSDVLTGGQGSDAFFFGTGKFGASDRVDGQGGADDQLGFQGDFTGANALVLGANQVAGVETIVLLTGQDARFGGGGAAFSYELTTGDGNVAAGAVLTINANTLRANESFAFNGTAETDGAFQVFGGAGADLISGGSRGDTVFGGAGNDRIAGGGGADVLTGGLGSDQLTGGAGADLFRYERIEDSLRPTSDFIADFERGTDRIDLSAIDADTKTAGNQAFTFIGEAAFSGKAGELRVTSMGTPTGTLEADVDGDGLLDFFVVFSTTDGGPLGAGDFLL